MACVASQTFALPLDGVVASGNASITPIDPLTMHIDQISDQAILNWRSFNIAHGETLRFLQPGAESVALNRVLGTDPSSIFGRLSANGHVFLVNPNGVLFGPTASVDVGGLIASTLTIRDEDFLAGRYTFAVEDHAERVVNQGRLTAAEGGSIALIGTQAINDGVISARLGTVALGAGQRVTVDFTGDDLIRVAVDDAAVHALVANGGLIRAEGGRVFLTARATDNLLDTVLNMDGVIEATSLSAHNGVIRLDGGPSGVVAVNGTLDASGKDPTQTGGAVTVLGDKVGLFDGALIDVSGAAGGGVVRVGGGRHGEGAEANARYTYVDPGAAIRADAVVRGDGGDVVVWADEVTRFGGTISARGGAESGNGGSVEVSGETGLIYQGLTDLRAPSGAVGTLLLDPRNITIALGGLDIINLGDVFSELLSTDVVFSPLNLQLALNLGNVTLQASNDIILSDPVTTLALLTNNNLTLEAGRSITIDANLSLRGGFTATTNTNNTAVVEGDRTGSTAGGFTMANNVTIDTSATGGDITINMSTGDPAGSGFASGNITVANLDAGAGDVFINQGGQTSGSSILRTTNSLISANSLALDVNNPSNTTGTIGISGTPINVTVSNLEAQTQGGDMFINSPTQGLNLGSASLGGLTGLNTGGGDLTLTTVGPITDSEALDVLGLTTLAAGSGNDITLDSVANDFGTLGILSGRHATVTDANALDLGATTLAGNLVATTAGPLTDSGTLLIGGLTTLATGSGNDITLDSMANDFGTLGILSGRHATVTDANALDLGATTLAGNLVATTAGPLTDSGTLLIDGLTTLAAGSGNDITLDSAANDFGTLRILSGRHATVTDANALDLGATTLAGNLVATTAGPLTDSGDLLIGGLTTLAAGSGNDITLDSALNDFLGTLSIPSARNVTLVDLNALDLGASTIAGNLLALAGGPITQSGLLDVAGVTELISLISDEAESIADQIDSAVATAQDTLPGELIDPVLGGLPPLPPLETPPIDLPPILEPPDTTADGSDILEIKQRDCEELVLTAQQTYTCREKSAKRPTSPDD
jgi:filamentous hemagglutinin family protein